MPTVRTVANTQGVCGSPFLQALYETGATGLEPETSGPDRAAVRGEISALREAEVTDYANSREQVHRRRAIS